MKEATTMIDCAEGEGDGGTSRNRTVLRSGNLAMEAIPDPPQFSSFGLIYLYSQLKAQKQAKK
jgi:hypothetical protein